ncbi:MAG: ThuA domain-containing protein, partial [Gemmataceae bacterium]
LGLTNINNVKYRADGALVALGYDGRVWLLRDTDGDGVEDRASLFWGNPGGLRSTIGMEVTPPGYPRGQGVFINGKSRCLLVVDTDGDDKADKEIEIAGGWKDTPHPVDGLGVALDPRDGSLFFGRGSANFTEPYLRDKDGKARYSTEQETGTIQRVSPDFKTREIVATGIRFPVAIRINAKGDLFCTDQEGATWSANGNPLDELLHVQKGRHYGFPARHPQHLPRVIDEPSTFDYGPQHQSTCGLNFNEPVHRNGPIFGPPSWRGDAIITGYSRGKLYRTQLEKTPAGYVARNHLLACLNMLTVDACVAPDGSLVVACHSGGPDWGSGPTGKGKLYKITHVDREQPQPALVWPNSPREVRVEFDRPVDPALLHDVIKSTKLTSGPFVRAGDRFESLWPGYAVVQAEKQTARRDVVVRSAQLTPDHRTLVLATDYNPRAEHRALQLPGMGRPALDASPRGGLPQHPAIDLDFDASGVEATWTPADGSPEWSGWLPHFDLELSRKWTVGSATHDALWRSMDTPGTLRLRARLHLNNMLNPVVQTGSRLDHEYPAEVVTVTFASPPGLRLTSPEGKVLSEEIGTVALTLTPQPNKAYPVELHLTKKKPGPVPLAVHWSTSRDSRARPMPLHRILVPWAEVGAKPDALLVEARKAPELEGGSWARGRKVYFSEEAACGKCHSIHGQGGEVGPDLSNLIHRDYPSVLRDITQPSFAINPDHLGYVVTLLDGKTLTGVVRTMGDTLRIGDTKGVITEVKRSQVETMKPSSQSIMPEGLPKQLGPDRMRDLMTFLLTEPPHMPRDYAGARPPQRTLAEVRAALAGAPTPPENVRPLKVLLVAGPKDHGPGEHDYPAWQKMWAELMASADKVEVKTAWEWPDKEAFARSDVIVFYQHGDWNGKRAADIDAYLERGGGLVYIHWAVDGRQGGPEFAKRIGLAGKGGVGFRHGAIQLDFEAKTQHPIRRNLDRLKMTDETYWKMVGNLPTERVLAWAVEEGKPRPQLWSLEQGRGRVFVSIPGHYSWTFDDPLFRLLLLRGIAWAAKEPVDRFNDLIWPGADIGR